MLELPAFVRTYAPQAYEDPLDLVADYYTIQGYHERYPDLGKTRLGRRFPAISPDRIHNWLHDQPPAVVRGLEAVEDRGWFNAYPHHRAGHGLCLLVTATYAFGSLSSDAFMPRWAPSRDATADRLIDALDTLDLGTDRGDGDVAPADAAALLGRSLVALGCPVGQKTAETVAPLPEYILDADEKTRLACAQVYALERGTVAEDHAAVQLHLTNRSEAFKESVATLFRSLTDEPVTLGQTVTISAGASRDLDLPDHT